MDHISHVLSQFIVGGTRHSLCVTALEEKFWKLVPGFLQTSPHATFSFANFILCCFAIVVAMNVTLC